MRRLLAGVLIGGVVVALVVADPAASWAGGASRVLAAAPSNLNDVINNIRNWLVGLLVGLATLFLTIGGVRYLVAGGDPSEVEKAKAALRYAAVGFCVAFLAPLLVAALRSFVGA